MTSINDNIYITDGSAIYKCDLVGKTISQEIKTTKSKYITSLGNLNNILCYTEEFQNSSSERLHVGVEEFSFRSRVGVIVCEGGNCLLIKEDYGSEYKIFDAEERKLKSIEDYTFEYFGKKPDISLRKVAVNLEQHKVAFRDDSAVTGANYVKDSLIVVARDKIGRKNNISLGRGYLYTHEYYGTVYRDTYGHQVGVEGFKYDLAYANKNGSELQLFKTYGSCVPESFAMLDDHTAILKVAENSVSICDFAKNIKYAIQIK
jgi:hypothetical protein